MRVFFIISFLFFSQIAFSQSTAEDSVEVEIVVGDSIEIGNPSDTAFKHIDFFRKTRWSADTISYDTATGFGFYKSFFSGGDFDVAELPASYKGKRFAVLGLEVLTNKNTHEPMYIIYLQGPKHNEILWVDFYLAVDAGEIKFIAKD